MEIRVDRDIAKWCAFNHCISFQGLEPPYQVTGVSLVKCLRLGRPCLVVTWHAPESSMDINRYRIQYKRSGAISWGSEAVTAGSPPATFTILVTLDVGTNYTVRVCATSASGDGEWSEEQTERTFRCEFYTSFMYNKLS